MRSLGRIVVAVLAVAAIAALAWWAAPGLIDAGGPGAGGAGSSTTSAVGIPTGATTATVRSVHDGDTLRLTLAGSSTELKVRLLGIDTPEVGEDAECFGEEARARTRELLPEGTVVTVIADVEPLDQYGRTLLHVVLADGTHLNRLLIDEGLAEARFFDPNHEHEREFRAAEAAARAAGIGMWGACG